MAQLNVKEAREPIIWGDVDDDLAIAAGDLVYWDSSTSEFKLADADGIASVATGIAISSGLGGGSSNQIGVTRHCILEDADAPFTVATPMYLHTTAGEWSHTRPTGAADVVQLVGVPHTTTVAEIDIPLPFEVVGGYQEGILTATAARLIVDTGPMVGVTLAAVSDAVTYLVMVPENAIAIASAYLVLSCDVTLDATDTLTITTSCSHTGLANDVATDTKATFATAVTADLLLKSDISSAFDATSFLYPGGLISVKIIKIAEGTGGDDHTIAGLAITFKCV